MKWKFVLVGALLIVVGSFLILTFYLYQPREPWVSLKYVSQYSEGEVDTLEVPLEGSTQYYLTISYVAVYSSYGVNITDPNGFNVTSHLEGKTVEEQITGGRAPQKFDVFTIIESFNSTEAGKYTFSIMGFQGKPFVIFEVIKVEAPEQPPSEGFVYVGCGLWVVGIIMFFISEGTIVIGVLEFILACVFFLVGGINIITYMILSRSPIGGEVDPFLNYHIIFGVIAIITFILGLIGGISIRLKKGFTLGLAGASAIVLSSVLNNWVLIPILTGYIIQNQKYILASMVILVLAALNLALLIKSRKDFTLNRRSYIEDTAVNS